VGQDDVQKHPDSAREDVTAADSNVSSGAPVSEAPPKATPADPAAPAAPAREADPDDTVGTGTSIALGCIAGTLLLIVIGLIFVGLLAVF
jgi:predicted lipid-binding transport protein (Tim44 family)